MQRIAEEINRTYVSLTFTKGWRKVTTVMDHVKFPQPSADRVHLYQNINWKFYTRGTMYVCGRTEETTASRLQLSQLAHIISLDYLITFSDAVQKYAEPWKKMV